MLMRNERLAQLRTRFDDSSHTLAVEAQGREVARGYLRTPAGRAVIERFFAVFCADELRGVLKNEAFPRLTTHQRFRMYNGTIRP